MSLFSSLIAFHLQRITFSSRCFSQSCSRHGDRGMNSETSKDGEVTEVKLWPISVSLPRPRTHTHTHTHKDMPTSICLSHTNPHRPWHRLGSADCTGVTVCACVLTEFGVNVSACRNEADWILWERSALTDPQIRKKRGVLVRINCGGVIRRWLVFMFMVSAEKTNMGIITEHLPFAWSSHALYVKSKPKSQVMLKMRIFFNF